MRIFVPRETHADERRVSLTPDIAAKLVKLGAQLQIESGLGQTLGVPDTAYTEAGATVAPDAKAVRSNADAVLCLRPPSTDEARSLRRGAILIGHLDPFNRRDLIRSLAEAGVSAISMEMIPRTTIAQKMDALSSQANLAGYAAVILAAERMNKILPLMMTPAGTIAACQVFIIGAGVAGLQAIATAKRLGARVEAYDTRSVVEEQVQSLGARFVKFDIGETGQTKEGYARALTEEQLKKQREEMAMHCAKADVVITTAQVFGRKAPVILTTDMVKGMKHGSIVVDGAVESGGNVECSKSGEEVMINGVRVIGLTNLPGRVPVHASQMYASNLYNLISHFWDKDGKVLRLDRADEIMAGCLITHGGDVVNETIRKAIAG